MRKFEDLSEETKASITRGLEDVKNGNVVPFEQVKEQLLSASGSPGASNTEDGKLERLAEAIEDPDIESMTDEEVSAYPIAEGFDLDDLHRKFEVRMFTIQAKLLAEDIRLLYDNKAIQRGSYETELAADKIKETVKVMARLCPTVLAALSAPSSETKQEVKE